MFFVWLVFTSNLNSQITWLKVKLKLVNLHVLNLVFIQLRMFLSGRVTGLKGWSRSHGVVVTRHDNVHL